jgi:hypothetical protein
MSEQTKEFLTTVVGEMVDRCMEIEEVIDVEADI